MATVKLNNRIREHIVHDILVHRFRKEVDALAARRLALANKIYEDLYSIKDRTEMARLPSGWLPEAERVMVQFGEGGANYSYLSLVDGTVGVDHRLRALGSSGKKGTSLRFQSRHVNTTCKVYDPQHPLTIEHQSIGLEIKRLRDQYDSAKKAAQIGVNSRTTVKALMDSWPEAQEFIKPWLHEVPKVPTVIYSDLNAALDLPPEEEELAA